MQPINLGGFSGVDTFVAKLNPTGSALVYSTYLGGSDNDFGNGIAVDTSGNAYVTGDTASTDFPTANPLQPARGGAFDAFVAKLNPTGSALVYSTYFGGIGGEGGNSIAVDTSGSSYLTGGTDSSLNFPLANPLQPAFGGAFDAFVAKLNSTGSALVYSTYLGGSGTDGSSSITVDIAGSAYVAGFTFSTDFPTANPLQSAFGGGNDAFVAKLNPTGSTLVYSTYLGGSDDENIFGVGSIAVDNAGNTYVVGFTSSTNFPTANPLQQPDSFQSGIGVISGFVCDAILIEIEFNGGSIFEAAYGTSRGDTQDVCGDTDNGFSLLFNWNLLGDGVHTIRALADGVEFANVTVTVTTLGLGCDPQK